MTRPRPGPWAVAPATKRGWSSLRWGRTTAETRKQLALDMFDWIET
jgi:hypothetical protein